nr:retrovirus-related Pol polyprotein from transposon TNT 1-94 [Tanacetum cinerariifolium]
MTTLAEHILVVGAENRPPMLEKSMYDSWTSRIRLFIKGKKNGRMMLDSIDNGLLGKTLYEYYWRFYQLINDMHTIGMTMQQVQVNTKFLNSLPPKWSKFFTNVKLAKSLFTINYDQLYAYLSQHVRHDNEQGEDPIDCITKAMAFLFVVASRLLPSNNQLRTGIATTSKGNYAASQAKTKDMDAYESDCDDISSAKVILMANLLSCDSDVLSQESQDAGISDTSSSAPNDLLDTVIRKLKGWIKSLSEKDSVENVKKYIDDIETINIELEHSMAKLLSENENLRKEQEHLKPIYKDQFDSIRKTRVQSNEHCASLIAQINEKSVENSDLNAQLQEKVFAIAALKNELKKLKGKNIVDTAVSKPRATIAPEMFKLDIEPISHRRKNNRDVHEVYLEKTIENTDTLCGLVECARLKNPSEPLLESACMFTKHVQELLVYVSKTCPSLTKPTEKLVAVTPINKDKNFRFAEPVTSSRKIPK